MTDECVFSLFVCVCVCVWWIKNIRQQTDYRQCVDFCRGRNSNYIANDNECMSVARDENGFCFFVLTWLTITCKLGYSFLWIWFRYSYLRLKMRYRWKLTISATFTLFLRVYYVYYFSCLFCI